MWFEGFGYKVTSLCGPFCGPLCKKPCETTRHNTKGASQKPNETNGFQDAPFQLRRV